MRTIKHEVLPDDENLRRLIDKKIVAAVRVPGFKVWLVARHGVNRRTLARMAGEKKF